MRLNVYSFFITTLLLLAMSACTPQFSYTWTQPDFQAKGFNKILIHGISETQGKADLFETTMTKVFKSKGINAISSSLTYGNKAQDQDMDSKISQLMADGVDAVMTVAIVDKNTETVYNEGMTYTVPSYGRTYRGYAHRTYSTVQEPGYYSEETTYLLEINLYELTSESSNSDAIIWAAQSEESKPTNPKKFNESYCEQIYEQLVVDDVLK